MPTCKPRVMLTLEPEDHAILARLSTLQHRPVSAILRDVVHEFSPIASRIADALEAAYRLQDQAPSELLDRMENAQKRAAPALMELLQTLEAVTAAGKGQTPA